MNRSCFAAVVPPIVLLVIALSPLAAASADVYDFVYVDAFQSDYDLRESYLFDVNNQGRACGFATDLPSYSGFHWSAAADKTRLPFSLARGINDAGKVVGHNQVFDIGTSELVTIPQVPGAVASPVGLDINNHGIVVGYAETCFCSNSNHTLQIPFIWDPVGGSRSISVSGAKELVKVNDLDVAVGNIRGGSPDGFVYEIATGRTIRLAQFLPTNPFPWTEAADINNHGVVTGLHRSNDAVSFHGYVWSEAQGATLLPHLNADPTLDVRPWAINDAGTVVGMAEVADHVWHAFVWDAQNGIQDLNSLATPSPNFILDRALGINELGWIVGDGHFGPNWSSSQAFVLIPRGANPTATPAGPGNALPFALRPNPSSGVTTIEFSLPASGSARITVFDLRGRRITEFFDAGQGVGGHQVRWDGRDESGRQVPSGAYLIRLEAAGKITTRRLALIR